MREETRLDTRQPARWLWSFARAYAASLGCFSSKDPTTAPLDELFPSVSYLTQLDRLTELFLTKMRGSGRPFWE
jgi:hypothetical protein